MNLELTEQSKNLLVEFIKQKTGLKIDESLSLFTYSLTERVKATNKNSAEEYVSFLMFHPDGKKEFSEFLELLTIKETYFFRNQPHFKVLKEKIIPEIIKRESPFSFLPQELRIWSAGCATGEEPYSIAIVIKEIKENTLGLQNWNVDILATDISTQAITIAKAGVYGERAVKFMEPELLKKYFFHRQNKYYLSDRIKNMVRFQIHNLAVDDFPGCIDIIFCRNVTIYFPKEITKQIMLNFYKSLKPNGFLIIGHSESLYGFDLPYRVLDMEDAFVYLKDEEKKTLPTLQKKSKNEFTFTKHLKLPRVETESVQKEISLNFEKLFQEAEEYFEKKKYEDATKLIYSLIHKNPKFHKAHILLGRIFANQGNYEKAAESFKKAIDINAFVFEGYFYLGLIYSKIKNDVDNVIEYFKKSIYLNPNFPLSHFYLANIYKEVRKIKEAIREYKNTLSLLESKSSQDDLQHFCESITKESLKDICDTNIKNLSKFIK